MSCELRNNTTGELKPFYQTSNGLFKSLQGAYNSIKEGEVVNIGFINTEDSKTAQSEQEFLSSNNDYIEYEGQIRLNNPKVFQKAGTIPVSFNPSTQVGLTNTLIRDGLISDQIERIGEDYVVTSQGVTEMNQSLHSEEILYNLRANSQPHGYEKKGNTFSIKPTFGKVRWGDSYYTEQELQDKVDSGDFSGIENPDLLILRQVQEQQNQRASNQRLSPVETSDTNNSLTTLLTSFLQKIGVSLVSIEEYKRKYKAKHGIEPDAKAFSDFANQIIAFKNGEITLNELTEEAAHFIVEGFSTEEVSRALRAVHNTQEWAEHAEAYREIYSKIYPADKVEEVVRREILGKFLANQLRNPTQRTEAEVNIFNYIINLLRSFFNRIAGVSTAADTKTLLDFSERVATLLYNQELQNYVQEEQITSSPLSIMYAISPSSKFYSVHTNSTKLLEKLTDELRTLQGLSKGGSKVFEQDVERVKKINEDIDEANITRSVAGIFGLFDSKVREIETVLKTLQEGEDLSPQDKQAFGVLKGHLLEPLQAIVNSLEKNRNDLERDAVYKPLKTFINETFERYNNVAGDIVNRVEKNAKEYILNEVERQSGTANREKMEEVLQQEKSDHSWFYKMFGQLIASKFPQLAQLGKLVQDISKLVRIEFEQDTRPFMQRLASVATKLPQLAKQGYFWSHRNRHETQERRNKIRAEVLAEILGIEVPTDTQWSQYTIEDYITENNLTVTPQEVVARWKFESDYRIAKSDIKVSSNKLQQNRLKQFELYKKLNISPETYQIISSHKADAANTRRLMGENADPNDPTNKSFEKDLQKIKFSRTSYKSVFDPATGQIRNGLSELRGDHEDIVSKKDNVVEIRKGFFVRLDAGAPIEARIAFELNKIDNNAKERKSEAEEILAKDPDADTSSTGWVKKGGKWVDNESLYSAGDASTLKEALADIWNKEHNKAVSIGLPLAEAERQANERAFLWFQRMASISFSQEYWDSMLSNKSFIEQLKVYLPTVENHPLWRIIQENNYKIAGILKKYQEVYDYREISVGDMTSFDRDLITALESANRENKEVLIQAVKDTTGVEDISIEYADMGERKPNNAFFDIFKDQRGKDYKSATTEERLTFVRGLLSTEKATSLEKLRNALEKHVKTKKPLGKVWSQVVEEITDEPIETVEDIRYVLEQYGQKILPSYYLRYAPEGYSELLDHIKDNFKNVVKGSNTILDRLIEGEDPNLEVTISQVTQEELGIKYEQSAEVYKRKLREAKALKDDSERLLRSYEAFLHIAGEDDGSFSDSTLDRSFLENFGMRVTPEGNLTKPTKNLDDFQNLIDLLELRAISLEDNDQLLRTSVFQFAKLPKSNTERIMTNPKEGTKYIVKDMIQYREDEEEASFLRSESRRIPKIGFTNMPLEDVSTDLFAVAMADVYNGKLYKHRKNNLNTAIALHNLLLTQKIRGKNIKDTEAWAMGNNYIDANFYGKQTSWNTKVDILGKQVDIAKALSTFRKFVQLNGLGFSIPVALTSLTTATAAKIIQRPVNFHLYDKASNRANIEFTKLMAGGVQDIGKIYTDSRIERIMQLFGNYDIRERLTNTAFGYVGHNLDLNRLGFAIHQMANYPIIPRIALSKLMEYRIIDGKFTSWAVFKTNERAANPKITNSELKSKFDATASNSLYDYLLLEGNQVFDLKKLEDSKLLKNKDGSLMTAAEIEAYTKQLYVDVSSSISYNISQYDGVIDSSQKTEAHRHPIFNFLMMYRSWMSIAGTRLFSPTRFDPSTATFEQGVIITFTSTLNSVIRDSVKNKENPFALARQTYNEMSPAQQANLRSLSFTLSAMSMMILITSLLVAAADDDDDDYITELAAYVAMRTLNETFNSSVGYPSELYSFLENPVTSSHTIKSITDILSVNNIGKEVTRGQYKGWDKYSTNLFKMTFLKNFYGLGSAESIESSRSGYQYFNEKQSLFSVLPLVKLLNEE